MKEHIEREKKFLIKNDSWKSLVTSVDNIKQGYLEDKRRIRLINNEKAVDTIKKDIDYRERIYQSINYIKKFATPLVYENWFRENIRKHWNPKILAPYIYPTECEPTALNPNTKLSLEWDLVNLGDIELDLKNKRCSTYVLNLDGTQILEDIDLDLSNDNGWRQLMQYLESIIAQEIGQIEEEREIDYHTATALLSGCVLLEKTRHYVPMGKHVWEIDIFTNLEEPLTMAEIELSQSNETFIKPSWLGEELTGDKKFSNFNLIQRVKKIKGPAI